MDGPRRVDTERQTDELLHDQVPRPAGDPMLTEAEQSADGPVRALTVLRRGLAVSEELRRGLPVTVMVALFAAAGRLIIPILVQLVLDHGLIGPAGYRPEVVWALASGALGAVLVVAVASRVAYIRLVRMAESVLLGLRVRAFQHIHRLSLASHSESRRGVLVARVTSDTEAMAQFMQWGAMSWIVNPVLLVATLAAMVFYSWQLTLLVLAFHLPLLPFLRGCSAARSRPTPGCATGWPTRWATPARPCRPRRSSRPTDTAGRCAPASAARVDRQYDSQMSAFKWFAIMLPVVDLVSSVGWPPPSSSV